MLDINFIKENKEKVQKSILDRHVDVDLEKLLSLDIQRREIITNVDQLRAKRNEAAKERNIEEGKKIKEELEGLEKKQAEIENEYHQLMMHVPNIPFDDVPIGKGESDNKVLKEAGIIEKKDFTPKDHVELGEALGILDFERGSKVAGSGFYYLKNEGALLEIALVQYGLNFLKEKGFIPIITPDLAREKYYLGTGYSPKGPEAQTFRVEESDLGLIATAEITLAGLHGDETFKDSELPIKYAGYSHCFRMEAGGYGKYSKGLYRVHQFTKVEMFTFTNPEQSQKMHEELLALEEQFWQSLGIPYRVLEMCTGDLGAQAARKYDLEAWMPGRGEYGEVTSTSNTTDYQSRRLNIKSKNEEKTNYAHTLNGTLVATSRAIIAILENFQQSDGSIKIPEVLHKYTGFTEIKIKK